MRVVDGADPYKIKTRVKPITKMKNTISIPSAHKLNSRCPVSATPTHMLRICVNPRLALSAGVRTMRARICSAISCAMFARVV